MDVIQRQRNLLKSNTDYVYSTNFSLLHNNITKIYNFLRTISIDVTQQFPFLIQFCKKIKKKHDRQIIQYY